MIAALLASIVVSSNCVSFTAVSTDCGLDAQIEFLFAGPDSDHDYESMFLTEDSVKVGEGLQILADRHEGEDGARLVVACP